MLYILFNWYQWDMIYHHDTGCHVKSLRELLIPSSPNFLLLPLLEIGTKDRYDLGAWKDLTIQERAQVHPAERLFYCCLCTDKFSSTASKVNFPQNGLAFEKFMRMTAVGNLLIFMVKPYHSTTLSLCPFFLLLEDKSSLVNPINVKLTVTFLLSKGLEG